ncbi:MAG TPA: HAMP domain-containing sensor histidine kinase [Acidimicrobiales bacterium]
MAEPRRWARLGTVRFRITATAALAVAVVLALTGIGLVATQRRVLTENLDESLASEAAVLAAALADGRPPAALAPVGDDDAVAQVVVGGSVVASTPNARGAPAMAAAPASGDGARVGTIDGAPTDEDERFRLVTRRVGRAGWAPQGTADVLVAAPLDDIDESVALLARSLAVAIPAVSLLLAALVWWLVGRTLRPVEAMRREAAAIGGRDLGRRVPVPPGGDEVARLARTLNGMLGRIEGAVRRQQRFVADASHELRSPLARVRAELEVDLAYPDGADLAATHRSVLEETAGMQALVDDLLVLARHDAAAPEPGGRQLVDLDEVVADQARRLRSEGLVAVDAADVGAAQVVGHRDRLGRALANLVDNAARHARSRVALSLTERDGTAVLAVTDDGPGIPPERREEVFERFSRLDGARSPAAGGTGLGLAIARDIVTEHGGTIAVDPDHRPGARLVIRLPLAEAAPGPP